MAGILRLAPARLARRTLPPARDSARVDSNAPRWSDVHQAGWIAARLAPWEDENTIVVPARFEAYARVLHPAETPGNGDRLVRWATPVLKNAHAIGTS